MKKKILVSALAILMVSGSLIINNNIINKLTDMTAVSVNADESEILRSGDYEYVNLNDKTVKITKYKGTAGTLILPDKINGKTVTAIGDNAFTNHKVLRSVTIPGSVKNIGNWVFKNCSGLKKITIPEGVTSIGNYVFYECTGLKSITLPKTLLTIGNYAFEHCEGLTTLKIPLGVKNIGYAAFYKCYNLTSIDVSPNNKAYSSENGYLYNKDKSELVCCPNGRADITIPKSVKSIGDYAFCRCVNLTDIKIPDNVTNIGVRAFSYCSNLKSITLHDGITNIGDCAFLDCKNLKSIKLPKGIINIAQWTFKNCQSLTDITIPQNIKSIDDNAFFGCLGLKNVTVPENIKNIGIRALGYYSIQSDNGSVVKKTDGFKIYCTKNSAAEKYAKENTFYYEYTDVKSLSDCDISVTPSRAFNGSKIFAGVTVKNGSKTLQKDIDYTLKYSDNINVGTGKVTITGKGKYTGTVKKTFKIVARNLSQCSVELSAKELKFTGSQLKPNVTIKIGDKEISKDNYTVSYSNNVKVGTASVTITGKNNLKGTVKKTFKIIK